MSERESTLQGLGCPIGSSNVWLHLASSQLLECCYVVAGLEGSVYWSVAMLLQGWRVLSIRVLLCCCRAGGCCLLECCYVVAGLEGAVY